MAQAKYPLGIVLGFALLVWAPAASGMHFTAEPPVLHIQGRVSPDDWATWEDAMARYRGTIDTVVLHNSPGGHSATGRKIGEAIRALGMRTVVAGRCRSACADMFLGGKERLFTESPGEAVLGYHGTYNKVTKQVNKTRPGDYYVKMTDARMGQDVIERFIRLENNKGFLFLVHPEQHKRKALPLAYLCKGDENTRNFAGECASVDGVDALSSGVVTSWKLVATPKAPKAPPVPKAPAPAPSTKNW